ncbi:MAG: zinc ribbon domain-containing protein [Chloroflexi bacterium]|nr:zinc ribbon domain-containing protein [Chloroflexota bacterium]
MPLYAYQCRACGHEFETRQSFHDAPLTDCPNCQTENAVFRVIQAAGVVFKGSGWYITDSKGKKDSVLGSTKSNSTTSTTTETSTPVETKAKPAEAAAD